MRLAPPEVVVNEEPPKLVMAWNELWMEIEYEAERGILDTLESS